MGLITKFILFISLIFCSSLLSSELNFTYKYEPRTTGFNQELYEITQQLSSRGFSRLSASPLGNLPLVHADEVLSSEGHNGLIMVKTGLIAPAHLRFKILTEGNLSLFHTNNASIAFYDFSQYEVKLLTSGLNKTVSFQVFNFFIPTANATDTIVCQYQVAQSFADLEKIGQKVSQSTLLKKIGECAVHALRGAEGKTEETKEFFTNLLTNPEKLWGDMKKSYNELKHFVSNISSELQGFYKTISDLSLQDQLDIACKLTGELVPSLVVAATGVGLAVATTKIILTTLPKLRRLKRLLELSKKHKLSSQAAKESLSCAI